MSKCCRHRYQERDCWMVGQPFSEQKGHAQQGAADWHESSLVYLIQTRQDTCSSAAQVLSTNAAVDHRPGALGSWWPIKRGFRLMCCHTLMLCTVNGPSKRLHGWSWWAVRQENRPFCCQTNWTTLYEDANDIGMWNVRPVTRRKARWHGACQQPEFRTDSFIVRHIEICDTGMWMLSELCSLGLTKGACLWGSGCHLAYLGLKWGFDHLGTLRLRRSILLSVLQIHATLCF